jgi:hypothetical protein
MLQKVWSSFWVCLPPVAVYFTLAEDLLKIKNLGVRVSEDGYTYIDDNEKSIRSRQIGSVIDFDRDPGTTTLRNFSTIGFCDNAVDTGEIGTTCNGSVT